MPLSRRHFLAAAPSLLVAAPARAADYREDARTARSVSLASPRAALGRCVGLLGETVGVPLRVAPTLAHEPLTGYVPTRPLRETLDALAELYDGVWVSFTEGTVSGYRLDPDPARSRAFIAARKALLRRYAQAIDAQAVQASAPAPPNTRSLAAEQLLCLAAWQGLSRAEQERLLTGEVVVALLRERAAARVLAAMPQGKKTAPIPPSATVAVSLEFDDRTDSATPSLRACVAAIGKVDPAVSRTVASGTGRLDILSLVPPDPASPPPVPTEDEARFGEKAADNGFLSGTRDDVMLRLAVEGKVPVLSRHRPIGGSFGLPLAGKPISQAIHELASSCAASARATNRGYWLLRSRTELLDPSASYPAEVVQGLAGHAPDKGPIPFASLAPLAGLSALQLSALERSNLCSTAANHAREYPALLRFYRSLRPEQQKSLFGTGGLPAAGLQPAQIVTLADERYRRGDWDLGSAFQNWSEVTLRFREIRSVTEGSVEMEALRSGEILTRATIALPVPEPEDQPQARR